MKCLRSTATLAAFTTVLALAASARAQVLEQVPSDAVVVLKISNLQAVSDKVAKFGEALGLAEMRPEFKDPMGALKQNLQIDKGVDTTGEMAFVFMKPAAEGGSPDESMIVLVPTSDYKGFLGNFEGAKTNGAISSFTPEGKDTEVHVANWGKYAVLSGNKAALAKKPAAGIKLSGLAAKQAKERDAFLFVNVPVVKDMLLPQLEGAREQILEGIEQELGADENAKQFVGVARAAVTQVLNMGEGFLRDGSAVGISFHLNDEGLSTTMMTEFKPDSESGKMVAKLKNSDQPMMAGLPNRKYFAYGGMVNDPEVSSQLLGKFLDPIGKELAGTESGKGFASMIDAAKRSFAATKSVSFGYAMPTGALGTDSVLQAVMVVEGDSKTIHEAQKSMLKGTGDMFKMMPQQEGAPKLGFEHAPNAKTVGGLKFDTYTYKMDFPDDSPQAAQMQEMITNIYGPNGMSGVFGPVDKDTYLVVQGGTDKLLAEAVKAAQTPKDTLSAVAGAKMVSGQLPAKRILVEYIALDNILNAAANYAKGQGLPIEMKLPANLPPIGIAMASEGSALRFDGFVPTQLIQSVVAAGMQTMMQMQGGGAGGAGEADGL